MASIEEKIAQLDPELQKEVEDFIEFLILKKSQSHSPNKDIKFSKISIEDSEYLNDFDWNEEENENLDVLTLVNSNFKDW
jgi:hypothetical protein